MLPIRDLALGPPEQGPGLSLSVVAAAVIKIEATLDQLQMAKQPYNLDGVWWFLIWYFC